jgi:nucleotide-binding universal stress UspA family protein
MGKYDRVLFCTDFSESADVAFDYACDFAQQHKGELHIFHATSEAVVREKIDKTFKEKYINAACYVEKCEGIKTECVAKQGLDHEQIVKYAKEANMDLIVMGTHGKSGFFRDMLIGSCARQVVRRSLIPVFVVPAPERAST